MAALAVLAAIIATSVLLFAGFLAACRSIRRIDKWGTLRPDALTPRRHRLLAYASRWDDNKRAYA